MKAFPTRQARGPPFRDSARDQHRLAPIASPDPGCPSDFPMPMQTRYEDRHNSEISTVNSSGSEDMGRGAYTRVRKPSAAMSQSREDVPSHFPTRRLASS